MADVAIRLHLAPTVGWVREKLVGLWMRNGTSSRSGAFISQFLVRIYSAFASTSYLMLWDGTAGDWDWLEHQLKLHSDVVAEANPDAVRNVAAFYQTWAKLIELNERSLHRGGVESDHTSASSSPPAKRAKPNAGTAAPKLSRLSEAVSSGIAAQKGHSMIWAPFEASHHHSRAVIAFFRSAMALLEGSESAYLSRAVTSVLAKLIEWVVRLRDIELLAEVAQLIGSFDSTTSVRLLIYEALPDGEAKLALIDQLLRAFDFAKPNLPLESPTSLEKFIHVMLLARPFPPVQLKKDPVEIGMRFSSYELLVLLLHALASAAQLWPIELSHRLGEVRQYFADLKTSKPRQAHMSGKPTQDLYDQIDALLSILE